MAENQVLLIHEWFLGGVMESGMWVKGEGVGALEESSESHTSVWEMAWLAGKPAHKVLVSSSSIHLSHCKMCM